MYSLTIYTEYNNLKWKPTRDGILISCENCPNKTGIGFIEKEEKLSDYWRSMSRYSKTDSEAHCLGRPATERINVFEIDVLGAEYQDKISCATSAPCGDIKKLEHILYSLFSYFRERIDFKLKTVRVGKRWSESAIAIATPVSHPNWKIDKVYELYKKGYSAKEISEMLHIPLTTTYYYLKDEINDLVFKIEKDEIRS